MRRARGARRRTLRTRWRARAGALVLSSDRQTTAASLRTNKALLSASASAENTWAPQPRRCSRWASSRAAVSSNSLRPAMQTTDPSSGPIPCRSAVEAASGRDSSSKLSSILENPSFNLARLSADNAHQDDQNNDQPGRRQRFEQWSDYAFGDL